jgi:hypothetical protein
VVVLDFKDLSVHLICGSGSWFLFLHLCISSRSLRKVVQLRLDVRVCRFHILVAVVCIWPSYPHTQQFPLVLVPVLLCQLWFRLHSTFVIFLMTSLMLISTVFLSTVSRRDSHLAILSSHLSRQVWFVMLLFIFIIVGKQSLPQMSPYTDHSIEMSRADSPPFVWVMCVPSPVLTTFRLYLSMIRSHTFHLLHVRFPPHLWLVCIQVPRYSYNKWFG